MKAHCNGKDHYFDCTCGFGGLGHRGSGGRRLCTTVRGNAQADLCRATSCPKCKQDVYFVRHNGGSVWFDALGKPWPKHPCFDDSPIEAVLRSRLSAFQGKERVLVGVVESVLHSRYGLTLRGLFHIAIGLRPTRNEGGTTTVNPVAYATDIRIRFSDGGAIDCTIMLDGDATIAEGELAVASEDGGPVQVRSVSGTWSNAIKIS